MTLGQLRTCAAPLALTWILVSSRSSCEVVMEVQTSASFSARTTWIILESRCKKIKISQPKVHRKYQI
jgi:hypothetical protein